MTNDARRGLGGRTGLLLAIALIALGATLFADVFVAEWGQSSWVADGGDTILPDRFVNVAHVQAPPGSIVRIYPTGPADGPYDRLEFYIVEHGEGQAYRQGGTAEHVYAQHIEEDLAPVEEDPAPGEEDLARVAHVCCPVVEIKRPPAPAGVDAQWLDLVWVLHFDEETTPPSSGPEREYFERWIYAEGVGATPQVTSPAAAMFHKWVAVPLLVLFSIITAVLAALWIQGVLRGGPRLALDEEAAAGVALVELGGRSLAFLRAILLGAAIPLAYVIWLSGFFFLNEFATTPGFGGASGTVMEIALFVGLIVLAAAWAAATLRVQRSHRRWRAMMDEQPLAL